MTPMREAIIAVAVALTAAAPIHQARSGSGGIAPRPAAASARVGPAYGAYSWPVQGPVIRGFEPPTSPYGPGHRGIDIGAALGTPIGAPYDGVVAFAGWVGGSLFISVDHPDGVRTTYSWLSGVSVAEGDSVVRGQVIGATGHGHPEIPEPHLHFGARVGSTYIDPMLLLEQGSVVGLIHLAPLASAAGYGAGRVRTPSVASTGAPTPGRPPTMSGRWAVRDLVRLICDGCARARDPPRAGRRSRSHGRVGLVPLRWPCGGRAVSRLRALANVAGKPEPHRRGRRACAPPSAPHGGENVENRAQR
jgi:hypothetical protein